VCDLDGRARLGQLARDDGQRNHPVQVGRIRGAADKPAAARPAHLPRFPAAQCAGRRGVEDQPDEIARHLVVVRLPRDDLLAGVAALPETDGGQQTCLQRRHLVAQLAAPGRDACLDAQQLGGFSCKLHGSAAQRRLHLLPLGQVRDDRPVPGFERPPAVEADNCACQRAVAPAVLRHRVERQPAQPGQQVAGLRAVQRKLRGRLAQVGHLDLVLEEDHAGKIPCDALCLPRHKPHLE